MLSNLTSISKFSLLVLSIIPSFLFSQYDLEWENNYGGSRNDIVNHIIETSDNGFLLIGHTTSEDNDVSVNKGSRDLWVVKISESGELLWEKTYGGSESDIGRYGIELSSGDIMILAESFSSDGDVSSAIGRSDIWLLKISNEGNLIWEKSYGGSGSETGDFIHQANDGSFLVTGSGDSDDGIASSNNGSNDLWLINLDAEGEVIWFEGFGGRHWDRMTDIIELSNSYLLAGSSAVFDGSFVGNHEAWLMEVTKEGAMIWEKKIGGTETDSFGSLLQADDGNYFAVGTTHSSNAEFSSNKGVADIFIYKFDSVGNEIWKKLYGGSKIDFENSAIKLDNGNIFIAGVTASNDGDVSGFNGVRDYWVLELDQDGNILWQDCYGSGFYDEAKTVLATNDGGLLVGGTSRLAHGDVSDNFGNDDIWMVKLTESVILSHNFIQLEGEFRDGFNRLSFGAYLNGEIYRTILQRSLAANAGFENISEIVIDQKGFYEDSDIISNKIYYYRVKSELENGEYVYSDLVSINTGELNNKSELTIFPNPVAYNSTIKLQTDIEIYNPNCSIIDTKGRKVKVINLPAYIDKGTHTYNLSASDIAPGIYNCRIESATTSWSILFWVL